MKTLKVIGKRLSAQQMQNVIGGKMFTCHCKDHRANPPFKSTWTDNYSDAVAMSTDLDRRCELGGSCSPSTGDDIHNTDINWNHGL